MFRSRLPFLIQNRWKVTTINNTDPTVDTLANADVYKDNKCALK